MESKSLADGGADAAEAEQSVTGFSACYAPQLLYSMHAEFAASASKCSAAARRRVRVRVCAFSTSPHDLRRWRVPLLADATPFRWPARVSLGATNFLKARQPVCGEATPRLAVAVPCG
jgi:hypothetical protein